MMQYHLIEDKFPKGGGIIAIVYGKHSKQSENIRDYSLLID